MDLGVSSPQIDNPARAFSFRFDGPLDMRMDTTRGESVAEWLATAELQQIAEVIRDYGEERFAVQVAKAIVARRQERGPLATTTELAELVAGTVKTREQGQDPATRTFQALRIFINAELEELQQALEASLSVLQARRPARGDQLPLAGRPHRQAVHREALAEVYDRRAPFAAPKVMKLRALERIKPSDDEVRGQPALAQRHPARGRTHGRELSMARINLLLLLAVVASALYLVHAVRVAPSLHRARPRAAGSPPPRARARAPAGREARAGHAAARGKARQGAVADATSCRSRSTCGPTLGHHAVRGTAVPATGRQARQSPRPGLPPSRRAARSTP
jgi:hypothetical protein